MKKLLVLVAVLAAGFTNQAKSNTINDNNDYNLYLSNQSVSFMETNVQFEVFLDGSFSFTIPDALGYSYRGQRARTTSNGVNANASIHYANQRETNSNYLLLDHSGILYAIGEMQIRYHANGKVKSIGSVQLFYTQDRLSQIGSMQILYTDTGEVSHTSGNINGNGFNHGIRGVKSNPQGDALNIKRNTKLRFTGNGVN